MNKKKKETYPKPKMPKGFWLAIEWVKPLNLFSEDTPFWHSIENRLISKEEAIARYGVDFIRFKEIEDVYGKIEDIDFDNIHSYNGVVIWTEKKVISVELDDERGSEYTWIVPRHPRWKL